MESEKWPAFITGFVLGMLVTLGVVGTFAWQKYQQAQAVANEATERAAMLAKQAEEEAARARWQAQLAEKELEEARKKLKLEPE